MVDAAFGRGQRVAGAAPAEPDQPGRDRNRGLLRRPGPEDQPDPRAGKKARPSRLSSGSKQSASTLHFIADEAEPHKIIAEYRDRLAPGSYLAVTHGTLEDDPAREGQAAEGVYRQASSQLHLRPLPDVLRFFEGFELVEPGLTWITEWPPERGTAPTGRQHSMRGGVGRRP